MPLRSPWTRTDVIGLGVLLAAALGAWLAYRAAGALGFGPEGSVSGARLAAGSGRARQGESSPGSASSAGHVTSRPLGAFPSGRASSAPAPSTGSLWHQDGPRDWSGPIATGLAPAESEAEAGHRMAEEFRRLTSDLEYSPGLREPIQQRMAASPEPWRPDPEVAGRPPPIIEGVSPDSAPAAGGAEVIIRGQNLRVAQVMFGAVAARITSVRPDRVTVLVPPSAAGQVRIALTNDDGLFAMAPSPFTLRR